MQRRVRIGPTEQYVGLNLIDSVTTRATMVLIQCPHCEEGIELEDDVFGLFVCPHCDEEFSWEDDDYDEEISNYEHKGFNNPLMAIVGLFIVLVAVIVGFAFDTMVGVFAAVIIFGIGIGVLSTTGIMALLRK